MQPHTSPCALLGGSSLGGAGEALLAHTVAGVMSGDMHVSRYNF